jgi:hypothetical protein
MTRETGKRRPRLWGRTPPAFARDLGPRARAQQDQGRTSQADKRPVPFTTRILWVRVDR